MTAMNIPGGEDKDSSGTPLEFQTASSAPAPLTPFDCDLRHFPSMLLDVARLCDSDMATLSTAEEFRASVLLWCKSWHQVPAASIPGDDRVLSQLAGFGRVVSEWLKVKEGALRGWIMCSDGRWYHTVVAEKANEAWASSLKHDHGKLVDRLRKKDKTIQAPTLEEWISAGRPPEFQMPSAGIPTENALKVKEGKGKEIKPTTPPNPLVTEGGGKQSRRRDSKRDAAMAERFERFYDAYPRKEARAAAEKAFSKAAPDDAMLEAILAALEAAKASHDWLKDGGQFVPLPSSWINGKRWTDEVRVAVTAYTDDELAVIDAYNAAMPGDWSVAERDVFVPSRAAAIRDFVSLAPEHPDMPKRYFAHCAENLAADARYGFEWLIKRETYAKVREGAVKLKGATQQ
jgi:hypothetical protein